MKPAMGLICLQNSKPRFAQADGNLFFLPFSGEKP
jgi:hypothetical protein